MTFTDEDAKALATDLLDLVARRAAKHGGIPGPMLWLALAFTVTSLAESTAATMPALSNWFDLVVSFRAKSPAPLDPIAGAARDARARGQLSVIEGGKAPT